MAPSDLSTAPTNQSLRDVFETTAAEIHVLNPTAATARRLLDCYSPGEDPSLRVYAPKATYDTAMLTFPFLLTVASKTESDEATLYEVADDASITEQHADTLVTDNHAFGVLWSDDTAHLVGIEQSPLAANLQAEATAAADDATRYDLRAPPRDELIAAYADRVGETYAETFTTLLDELNELPCQYKRRATVDTAILAGVLTEAQLYHISRASDALQFGSIASYSRRKKDLQEAGYIDTEKIPQGVGRPRERLIPGPELEQSVDAVVEILHSRYRD
jgi:hypothetical protein